MDNHESNKSDMEHERKNDSGEKVNQKSEELKSLHLHFHLENISPGMIKEVLYNLALDWQGTITRIEQIEKEINIWQKRKDDLSKEKTEQISSNEQDQLLRQSLDQRIEKLKNDLMELFSHQNQLEQEIETIKKSKPTDSSGPESEYSLSKENVENRRNLVKNNLETMLGSSIQDIILEEKFEQDEKEKKVDEDLKRLKNQMHEKK